MQVDFGCSIGDRIYFVDLDKKKVRRLTVDCLKVFENNVTAHGKLEYSRFSIPYECSIKYLNKKFIFTKRKWANEWLKKKIEEEEKRDSTG